MTIAILYREELKEYGFGPGHSFRGDRYEIFPKFLKEVISDDYYQIIQAKWATDEDLIRICKENYMDFTKTYNRAAIKGFKMIGDKVKEISKICDGKAIDLIASGYNKGVLPYAWFALISALADIEKETLVPIGNVYLKFLSES